MEKKFVRIGTSKKEMDNMKKHLDKVKSHVTKTKEDLMLIAKREKLDTHP